MDYSDMSMTDEQKKFYHSLFSLVVPIAFQNFMWAAVSASDAVMLGWVSQDMLSAVSLAGQVTFVLSLFYAAVTTGTTILAAQYWGRKDTCSVEKILGIALRYSCIVSLIFFAAAFTVPAFIMKLFTPDETLVSEGAAYLRIVSFSYLFAGLSQVYLCIMKTCGKAVKSTIIITVSMVSNIIMNGILIFGAGKIPPMHIAGAAYATVAARMIECVLCALDSAGKECIKFRTDYIVHADKVLRGDFIKYTLPVLGNQLVWGCGITMYSVIMGHMGTDAVAANSIANIVKNLAMCFCFGIGTGGGILVGNELGAGNLSEAKRDGRRMCRIALASGVMTGALVLAVSPAVIRCSGQLSETARSYLQLMFFVCTYYLVGQSINSTTIAGIFCAGGDSKFGFICDTITLWAVTVPLGCIAAFVLRLPVMAVYILINIDEIIKLPAVYRHYRKYEWVRDLTRTSRGEKNDDA
jgi:putative MATE family efflux protein